MDIYQKEYELFDTVIVPMKFDGTAALPLTYSYTPPVTPQYSDQVHGNPEIMAVTKTIIVEEVSATPARDGLNITSNLAKFNRIISSGYLEGTVSGGIYVDSARTYFILNQQWSNPWTFTVDQWTETSGVAPINFKGTVTLNLEFYRKKNK